MEKSKELNFSGLHAKDAEAAILGTILTFEDALIEVSSILVPDMFYDLRNQCIYAAILKADSENLPVDLVSVAEKLKKSGDLERAGNYAYLSKITNYTGDFARIGYYARIVVQKYVQRELVRFGSKTIGIAGDDKLDVATVISQTAAELDRINGVMSGNSRMEHIADVVDKSLELALKRERDLKEGRVCGIPTGFSGLDRILFGLHGGDVVILAGRPGSGKTSIMLHMLKSAAMAAVPVCAFSLEMNSVSLSDRLILSVTNISPADYRRGKLSQADFGELSRAQTSLSSLPIRIDDRSGVTMQYIRSVARMMYKRGLCKALYIDYLQLLNSPGDKKYNREQEVAQISGQVKMLAKELDVPVVLLSQLNRDCEKRTDKKPELADLRESGAIEQDADVVLLVYRPEYYGLKTMDGEPIKGVGKIIVAKQREGAVGEVKFSYDESLTRLNDYVPGLHTF